MGNAPSSLAVEDVGIFSLVPVHRIIDRPHPAHLPVDIAFSLDQNQYNGETYVELSIADFRLTIDDRVSQSSIVNRQS